jgi:S-adenosylmethionine:tRNA ribosyltransferase-isomerase
LSPAAWPRESPLAERLLVVDPRCDCTEDGRVGDLAAYVRAGDLLVVNDAATLPASLQGRTASGAPVEARLLASRDGSWRAVLFGAGDWRTRTEDRPAPPLVREGDVLTFGADLRARVAGVSPTSTRLVTLRFEGDTDHFWSALYRHGRPIQYAYVAAPLALWHVQTPFASRPWSSEMPSAARPLAWELVLALRAKGASFASITHAAGLSSTGDVTLDAALPMRESYEVPVETADAIARTRARGGRVIAVGTTVVRALESAALQGGGGTVAPGIRDTDLVVGSGHTLRVVEAIFTGMHEPGTSHDTLLQAFAPRELLLRAFQAAQQRGFVGHEFGDSMLVGPGILTVLTS